MATAVQARPGKSLPGCSSSQSAWTNGVRGTKSPTEVGGEIKYGVTPSLTLDLTYNTDFAQVEVDEQRLEVGGERVDGRLQQP